MAKIELLAPFTFKWEGGYQCDPVDKGNYNSKKELVGTKYGVSALAYESHYGKVPTKEIMENLTPEEGAFVLQTYWNNCKGDQLKNQSIANVLVDWHYNAGFAAIKSAQKALGLLDDGDVGPKTLAVLNSGDGSDVFLKLWKARKSYYQNVAEANTRLSKYLNGWLNRLNDFKFKA
jgi:lysozyme family protein